MLVYIHVGENYFRCSAFLKNYINIKFKDTVSRVCYAWKFTPNFFLLQSSHGIFLNIFQTLGDAKKREQYDRFGYTAAREQQKPSHGFHSPFGDGFFREFNFNFNGFNQGESYIQKFDINLR